MTETVPLPEAFLARVGEQLGDSLPDFLRAMESEPVRGVRFHPFRRTEGLLSGDLLQPVPWTKGAWTIREDSEAGKTAAHDAGAFYLQDPGAMIPAEALDVRPGEKVLDLCAAPGGKTTQLGLALAGRGLLISNEPIPKRAQTLSRNLERMGIPNAIAVCAWPAELAVRWPEGFDAVMVDAPCSGEGMFRRHPETRAEWSSERAAGCARRQAEILDEAAGLVRPGGRLVYATCTWNPAENGEQVDRFLLRHPEYEPEAFSLPGAEAPEGRMTRWIQDGIGEGQYIAKMRRRGNGEARLPAGTSCRPLTGEERAVWAREAPFLPEPTGMIGSCAVRLEGAPALDGLRVFRAGLRLGEIRGRTVIPDHAAALALKPPDAPVTDLLSEEAGRYLAGETVRGDVRGWTLIRWRGLILGWGKGSGGIIRNHYPKGLRNARLIVEEERRT